MKNDKNEKIDKKDKNEKNEKWIKSNKTLKKSFFTTLILFLLIICSLISWLLWTVLIIRYYPNILYIKPEIIREETVKTEKITNITSLQSDITKLVKKVSPWVVSIIIKKDLTVYRQDPFWFFQTAIWTVKRKIWWWTWFFITKDWKVITNKHVVSDTEAEYTIITNDWWEFDAILIATDPVNDLAILQAKTTGKIYMPLEITRDKDELNIWQFAIAVWNALSEYQNTVSLWVVSWKNRTIWDDTTKLTWLIQTDAAINPGNSWWPLINLDWKVIWINTAIISWAEWLWFSIPLTQNRINYMIRSIDKYGTIKKPFIWINAIINSPWIQKELWLKVNYWAFIPELEWSVIQWSNAEKAWIEPWDLILEIDWIEIDLNNPLSSILQTKVPWDTIKLKVLKKKKGNQENWEEKIIELILWES